MSRYKSKVVDLRAKAGEYRNKATAVADTDLHAQFVSLAERYEELAEKLEATQLAIAGTPGSAKISR